ncbi:MAG: sigma-70 family RNA polymerase sigma factor [Bacilli bacterium]|nr:sigma-70 family RNA polymerase sigma factor [Bacilli bacterium]
MSKSYNNENDYELLYLVSENNDEARDIFYNKYENIIKIKALKYKKYVESMGYDYNDILQEGRLGLTNAINSFKEHKDVKFYTFANLCIDRQLATFIRDISRDKHKLLNTSISLDSTTNSVGRPLTEIILDEKNVDPELSFIEAEEKEELYNKIDELLTNSEKDVFDLRVQGFSYKEIASILDITPKAVDGTISRIKNKLSNIINK